MALKSKTTKPGREPKPDWMLPASLRRDAPADQTLITTRPGYQPPKQRDPKPAWMLPASLLIGRPAKVERKHRPANTGPSAATRRDVIARDKRCVCCGADCAGGIPGVDFSLQHIVARGAGGTTDEHANDPSRLVLMCGDGVRGCHGRAESQRTWAERMGYLRRHGINQNKGTVRWHGRRVRLTNDFRVFDARTGKEVSA